MTEELISNGEEKKDSLGILLDSSYPLLQKFRDIAAGTYKHCQIVATIMEGISTELNLNTTNLKICGMYHDIGKIFNPSYFTENQIDNENPHDKLEPIISYQIISRHISDTALILLGDKNFPRELIEIICQHHGTNIIQYFFDKSKSEIEDNYRYKSLKPTCIESAILMICDCVEARSKSMIQSDSFNAEFIIEDTINNLLSDNQLDEVYMKLGDLQKIKTALKKELQGLYQKRVSYDK